MTDQTSELTKLNDRSRDIFRRIVESYLTTGEPVGSRNLARVLPTTLSPASIRNVMSDLEHAGLIFAPHTSAGRMPTQLGLRLFVDGLLEVGELTPDERKDIEAQMAMMKPMFAGMRMSGAICVKFFAFHFTLCPATATKYRDFPVWMYPR